MQFFTVAALFVAGVLASPLETRTGTKICPDGLFANPLCCATDILGLVTLDCAVPQEYPRDGNNFREICAKRGAKAQCCVLPILGQSLLCQGAIGA